MKKENLVSILELKKFLLTIKFEKIHITKKRVNGFNSSNKIKIENIEYVHGKIKKKNVKILDNNRILLRLQKTKHGYYRIEVTISFLNDDIISLLDIFLSLLNE